MKNIILTKRDLVENILTSTEDLGISKLLAEFLTYGKNNCDNIFSLYLCIEKLASPMLSKVPKTITSRKELYKTLKQVFYVSGKWLALADFYFLMNFRDITANQFTVTTVYETDTNFIRKYVQNNRTVTITLSDSLYAVVCDVSTLYIERMDYNDTIATI
nr:MAG TPA: hypothetical protein [Caudoviricetes sp.]